MIYVLHLQMMYSKRQNKVSRLLQKELADIFQKEYSGRAFITVTVVRISPDLSYAKVYLSIMEGTGKSAKDGEVSDNIMIQTKEIRKRLAARIKNKVRIIPDLKFFIDDSLDYEENIDRLLGNLKC